MLFRTNEESPNWMWPSAFPLASLALRNFLNRGERGGPPRIRKDVNPGAVVQAISPTPATYTAKGRGGRICKAGTPGLPRRLAFIRQADPIQIRATVQTATRAGLSTSELAIMARGGRPHARPWLPTLPAQSLPVFLAVLVITGYPAQQDSFDTSISKVCAASFRPSTVVR